MQRCGSSYCNPVGPCSCCSNEHFYHHSTTTAHANSFSMLFSMPNHNQKTTFDAYHDHPMIMTTSPSSSSSSVDCTLSLSTPSSTNTHHRKSNISSKLCGWNIFQSTNKHKKPPTANTTAAANNSKLNSRGGGGGGNSDSGLTSRRCANCDTTSTPLWRNGPKGPKSLCNACGIRYKKEERRATNTTTNGSGVASAMSMETQEQQQQQHYSWTTQHSQQAHMMPMTCPVTEFSFIEDDHRQYSPYMNSSHSGGGAANVPFLSWRLNVPDRPSSLVHDYI